MKLISKYLFISAVVLSPLIANAGETYVGIGYHLGTYDESGFPDTHPNAIKLKVGKYVAPNIAIESHLLFGSGSDTVTYLGVDVDLRLKTAISVFVREDLPLSGTANLYGLLGLTRTKLEMTALGITDSGEDSGFSYGFGAEVSFGKNMYISGEYIAYISESDYDYTGFNLGISKKF